MMQRVLGSPKFIWFVIGLLVLQAGWIALSGVYPMAFDEDFHFGIIGLYTKHISPFWSSQPVGADVFGVVFRDPSFLYHYLMSFLLRLISFFTDSQYLQIIILRFVNIGLFSSGIYVFWKLLRRFGASLVTINAVLLFFVFVPVVSLLAAQINYDNLLFPLVGLTFIFGLDLLEQISNKKVRLASVYWFLLICLFASLVKYAFLPIMLAVTFILLVQLYRYRKYLNKYAADLRKQFFVVNKLILVASVASLLVLGAIFIERYAINITRYHRPAPECSKALSIQSCSSYGPWIRDYNFANSKGDFNKSPIDYSNKWLRGMWSRLYFAVDGPKTNFDTKGPFFFPAISAIILFGISIIAIIFKFRVVWQKYNKSAILITSSAFFLYVASLWIEEYKSFLKTGQPVAINGRYLIPVMLPLVLLAVLSISELLGSRRALKKAFLLIALVAVIYGGGALTYILRGDSRWYWPNSPLSSANLTIKRNIGPYIYGFYRNNQFMP